LKYFLVPFVTLGCLAVVEEVKKMSNVSEEAFARPRLAAPAALVGDLCLASQVDKAFINAS
jgi:hypothetical protein